MKSFKQSFKNFKSLGDTEENSSKYSIKAKVAPKHSFPKILNSFGKKKKKKRALQNITQSTCERQAENQECNSSNKLKKTTSLPVGSPGFQDENYNLARKRKLNEPAEVKSSKLFKLLKSKSCNFTNNDNAAINQRSNLNSNAGSNLSIQKQRQNLPIFQVRNSLIKNLRKNTSLILIGETACGKTTQIPQFIHEVKMEGEGMIGITQPRRVAAVTIAERVSSETCSKLGGLVGYTVRFDDTTSEVTKLKYMTDGMLLREAMIDPLLRKYTVIILDEAHERTIHTDVLFGIVKHAQRCRASKLPLKIVVMSATMDVDHFSKYFCDAPVFYLEGRQFPVQINYLVEPESDYVYTALRAVFQIHQMEENGDILIFCTGQEEIESMANTIREASKHLTSDKKKIQVCPLYAALPSAQQLQVFQDTLPNNRKIILATNIAETSITIPGIKFVIDTGMVKSRIYNPGTGLSLLKVQRISQAQAWQRSGRAGRQCSGKCYRLYTEKEYQMMKLQSVPEIQRCNLSSVVLELVTIGVRNVNNFDFMDKPSAKAVDNAINNLKLLGALEDENKPKLTILGKKMANFPLDPIFAKVVLTSKELNCSEEILSIISMLSVESIFFNPANEKTRANEVRKRYNSSEGDLITFLNVFRAFKSVNKKKEWCSENFIHHRNMKMAMEVRKQLAEICHRVKIPLKSCGQDMAPIRKCLAFSMFKNAAELCGDGSYLALDCSQKATIHPSSCLFKSKPSYVIYREMVKTTKCYIRDLCVVDPDWLHEACPSYFRNKLISSFNS